MNLRRHKKSSNNSGKRSGKRSSKKMLVLSFLALLIASIALVAVTYSWIRNQRSLSTAVWIKTPIVLNIGSGNNHDIQYLDMGNIDVTAEKNYKDYVICVYGTPVDNYSLQLAYTTNIAFHYEVYRAEELEDGDDTSGDDVATSTYTDEDGTHTEYFKKSSETSVISGKTLKELEEAAGDSAEAHQSHDLSYGDENGKNACDEKMVQSNAEPLYWLAEEKGTNVLQPINKIKTDDGTEASLDYFIIRVSWNPDEVTNDKETDIVYLTASR
jgi:hypothetical protein